MGLMDALRGTTMDAPVVYMDGDESNRRLHALEDRLDTGAAGTDRDALVDRIERLKAGIAGEKRIMFELMNSRMPLFVLHDLNLAHDGLAAQIDFLVVARKLVYVIECKNLYGDIEITEEGDFVRLLSRGHYRRREGIYSPITQNQRHLELIKALRGSAKGTIARALFERFFDDTYRSVVVLANPRTVLNATAAPRDVRDQVIRADRLKEYITDVEKRAERAAMNDKEMEELARFFKDANDRASETAEAGSRPAEQAEAATSSMLESKVVATVGVTDVKETSQSAGNNDANVHESDETADASDQSAVSGQAQDGASSRPSCPRCGSEMVLRTARRGEKAETRFYGCSRFPHCRGILPVES